MNNYKVDVLIKKDRAHLYLDLVQRIAQESYCVRLQVVHCAKLIVQSGIKRFIYIEGYRDSLGVDFLKACGVEVLQAN
jgi:hypothetical protein